MGLLVVTAVLVVTLGRLGDIYGRVRIYNAGFVVFTLASIALALDPLSGGGGAMWLTVWRLFRGVGASMLFANSTAILTDACPVEHRGMALGINQVAAIAGSFVGLILGGLLSEWDCPAVFFVSVPIGVIGTVWSYLSLHELSKRQPARIDWWGSVLFAVGLTACSQASPTASSRTAVTRWGGRLRGCSPGSSAVRCCSSRSASSRARSRSRCSRCRCSESGRSGPPLAGLLAFPALGGLQFMLIIWLQGIWLPLHGYDFADTPLWAAIYLLPLMGAFLIVGPLSGALSDRFGARTFATGGLLLVAASFLGLVLLPVDFNYGAFAALLALNGIGSGLFSAPNTTVIMNSVPAGPRGAASGMRATFFHAGSSLSIGIVFSLMIVGLAATLPTTPVQRPHLASRAPGHCSRSCPPAAGLTAARERYVHSDVAADQRLAVATR